MKLGEVPLKTVPTIGETNVNPVTRGTLVVVAAIAGLLPPWAIGAQTPSLPPDPDNAAFLYYQAFLLRSEPAGDTLTKYEEFVEGGELTNSVRRYLWRIGDTITLADDAVKLAKCDWGIQYSRGFSCRLPQVQGIRSLARDLSAHAQMLAVDGDCRGALTRCLMMRQMAGQIGEDMLLLYASSHIMDGMALLSIQHVLGRVPPDAETLRWLKQELPTVNGAPSSPAHAWRMDFELAMVSLRNSPGLLKIIRDQLVLRAADPVERQAMANLTDEELIARARRPYASFLDSAIETVHSDMPYTEVYARLQKLADDLKENYGNDPAARQVIMACVNSVHNNLWAKDRALRTLLDVAIEIYLVVAETGRLPQRLADDWPRDPLTGESFDYEVTEEGFILRSRTEDIPGGGNPPLEFRVHESALQGTGLGRTTTASTPKSTANAGLRRAMRQ